MIKNLNKFYDRNKYPDHQAIKEWMDRRNNYYVGGIQEYNKKYNKMYDDIDRFNKYDYQVRTDYDKYLEDRKIKYNTVFENNFSSVKEYVDYLFSSKLIFKVYSELRYKKLGCFCTSDNCHTVILNKLLTKCESDVREYLSLEKPLSNIKTYKTITLPDHFPDDLVNHIISFAYPIHEYIKIKIEKDMPDDDIKLEEELFSFLTEKQKQEVQKLKEFDTVIIENKSPEFLDIFMKISYLNTYIYACGSPFIPKLVGLLLDRNDIDINYFKKSIFYKEEKKDKPYSCLELDFLTSKIGNEISQLCEKSKIGYLKIINNNGIPYTIFSCGPISDTMSFITIENDKNIGVEKWGDIVNNTEDFIIDKIDKIKYNFIIKSDHLWKLIFKKKKYLLAKVLHQTFNDENDEYYENKKYKSAVDLIILETIDILPNYKMEKLKLHGKTDFKIYDLINLYERDFY